MKSELPGAGEAKRGAHLQLVGHLVLFEGLDVVLYTQQYVFEVGRRLCRAHHPTTPRDTRQLLPESAANLMYASHISMEDTPIFNVTVGSSKVSTHLPHAGDGCLRASGRLCAVCRATARSAPTHPTAASPQPSAASPVSPTLLCVSWSQQCMHTSREAKPVTTPTQLHMYYEAQAPRALWMVARKDNA